MGVGGTRQFRCLLSCHEAEDLPVTQTLRSESNVENEKQHTIFSPESNLIENYFSQMWLENILYACDFS